ncbi:hypothetical protein F5H01DRAFT_351376 [Linnemannia elongata]|nr:hypothetical protein F5H01DRAFT_351376 [Linnemannia elongata]
MRRQKCSVLLLLVVLCFCQTQIVGVHQLSNHSCKCLILYMNGWIVAQIHFCSESYAFYNCKRVGHKVGEWSKNKCTRGHG